MAIRPGTARHAQKRAVSIRISAPAALEEIVVAGGAPVRHTA